MKKIFVCFLILSIAVVAPVAAQQQTEFVISGTVSDETDVMPGVTIYVRNKPGVGTTSDMNGKFSIKAARGDVVLFSFVGYEEVQYYVDRSISDLAITMKESATAMEEVVISALGTVERKATTTGALGTIDTKQLQVPASSLANILSGRMGGFVTVQASGEPGKNISEFWIRGIGTFGANDKALVLIDGLEGDLNSIDPADIESFSILKDASATAVYGVRGANGVVLVTTKRGEEGRMQLSARTNFTVSKLQRMPDYVRSYDYALLMNEAREVRGDIPRYSQREMDIIQYKLDRDLYPDVDWQDEIMKPVSFQQTYYLSARGGGSIARYFLSLATSNESAAYKTAPETSFPVKTGYNTYSFRTNLDINLTKTTKVFFNADGYLTRQTQPGTTNTEYLWFALSSYTPILVPLVYSNGQLPSWGLDDNMSPYVQMNHLGTRSQNINTYKSSIELKQDLSDFISGLDFRIQGAFDSKVWYSEGRVTIPELYRASGRNVYGELQTTRSANLVSAYHTYSQRQYRKYHLESTLNYSRLFGSDHRVSGLVYYYMSDAKDTDDIKYDGIGGSMTSIPKRYQGISSRFTYQFRDTYLLDFNFGYTGSENFQKGQRFGFFPALSVGWVPTQYEYVKENLPWISFFKIRASYGSVGNDRLSSTRFPYLTIVRESGSPGWGYTGIGISEASVGADNLMWEKALKRNLGIDANFLQDRLRFTIDFFNDKRDGIFQRRENIASYVGLQAMPYGNVGAMRSYGSDGNISYTHIINTDMDFTVRANYGYATNKINNWEQAPQPYDYLKRTGYPHDVFRGFISMGLFKNEEDVLCSPLQSWEKTVLPGDIKYKDVNGDGVIDSDDRVPLSYPTYPRLNYGFGGEFRWKSFTVSILFKGTGNNDYYHVGQSVSQFGSNYTNGMGYVPFYQGEMGNVMTIVADQKNRWTPESYSGDRSTENPNARFPRLSYEYNANNVQPSDFWKANKKFLRFQELMLSYNWKSDFLQKAGLRSVDLQLVGNNLYIWDQVNLFDPEQAQYNGRAYPIPLRVTFQIYVNF